jgi:hypothetical protein
MIHVTDVLLNLEPLLDVSLVEKSNKKKGARMGNQLDVPRYWASKLPLVEPIIGPKGNVVRENKQKNV